MKQKSHVKVFVRTRPTARPYEGIKKDGQAVTVNFPKDSNCLINNQLDSLTLKFDGVLDNVSQEAVYEACAREAVGQSLCGYNSTIFAYGQTAAGKTFTMSGDPRNYSHRGIIPRALQHAFREVDMRSDRLYRISVSFLEIYNDSLRDLLAEDPAATQDSLAIVDDAAAVVVRGLTKVPVASEEEALRQFFLGDQARSTAPHALNGASSRSHALFTLHIEMRASAEASERALLSKLHLVDLAGSERIKKTQAAASGGSANQEQLRESSCINKSLSFLEQVVSALARGDAHVPFRQSKLTAALRDGLGGNSNTVMVANLWPEEAHLEECVSTLRFAARVRYLQTDPAVNESADPLLALAKAERQLRELRQELAMRDMLSGRARVGYEDLSDGERGELQGLVLRYLTGAAELEELPTDSLKRIKETYKAFKAAAATWVPAAAGAKPDAARAPNTASAAQGGEVEPDAAAVGEVDAVCSGGFCIGTAPLHARPLSPPVAPGSRGSSQGPGAHNNSSSSSSSSSQRPSSRQQLASRPATSGAAVAAPAGGAEASAGLGSTAATTAVARAGQAPGAADRNVLFSRYKHSVPQGVRQSEAVRQQQALLAQHRQGIIDAGAGVNAAKSDIDAISETLASRRQVAASGSASATGSSSSSSSSVAGPGVLDDEAYQLMQQLRVAKARYRTLHDDLQELRAACDAATDAMAAAKEALLSGFDSWLLTTQQQQQQQSGAGGLGAGAAAGNLAWAGQHGAGDAGSDGDEAEDPDVAYERVQLSRKTAATGDPASAAYHAAKRATATKAGGARRP